MDTINYCYIVKCGFFFVIHTNFDIFDITIFDFIYTRYVPIWEKFDYAKTGSRRSVELPKDLRKPNLTYLA